MEPQLHLQNHNDRVQAALHHQRDHAMVRPRAPGRRRELIARQLRRLADRLDAQPVPAHQARQA